MGASNINATTYTLLQQSDVVCVYVMQPQGQGAAEAQQAEDQLAFQPAAKFAPIMDAVHHALCQRWACKWASTTLYKTFQHI